MEVQPTLLEDDDQRVLLLLSGERDRELLAQQLEDQYDVAVRAPDDEWGDFDICVVDATTYRQVETKLDALKSATDAYLPVLLLVPNRMQDRRTEWVAQELDSIVGDVLVVPAPKHELEARVSALLRAHRQSKRLALFRRAMDEASVGITITDPHRPDNPIIYTNDEFSRITGYEKADVIGRNCRFLQGPDTDAETVERIREAIDANVPVTVELLNYRADGTSFWNLLNITPVRDNKGTVTHYIGFQRDVTERKERARELKRYETIVQTTSDPIYVLDPEERFVRVNDAMIEASGYDREDLLGSHVSLVSKERDIAGARELVSDLLAGDRERATFEWEMIPADGNPREYATSLAILRNDGEFGGIVGTAHDVTDLRAHQRRLTVLDRILRHNLRNRMNVVTGYAMELADHPDPEVADLGANIERSGKELMELADSARDFENVISGTIDQTTSTIDVADIAENVVLSVRTDHPAADISTDLPEAAPALAHGTFELAVDELVENAIVHSDKATPSVEVSVGVADGEVQLRVADDGPGIDDIDRRALMSGTESQLEHSQGLGLWLVRWTVESVGGDLDIAEDAPRGTVITLTLPLASA